MIPLSKSAELYWVCDAKNVDNEAKACKNLRQKANQVENITFIYVLIIINFLHRKMEEF